METWQRLLVTVCVMLFPKCARQMQGAGSKGASSTPPSGRGYRSARAATFIYARSKGRGVINFHMTRPVDLGQFNDSGELAGAG